MALNVIRCKHGGETRWAVVRGGRVSILDERHASTASFVASADVQALRAHQGEWIDLSEVTVLAPVTQNQRFVCQGANYRQHMIESGINPDDKSFNMIFTKASSSIVAAYSDIVRPTRVQLLDYEIELGLVMRRDIACAVTMTESNLLEYVAGIVIVNDVSARDIQIPEGQFHKGKSFRTFGPVGPYLCLLEESDVPRLASLQLELKVDGEVRQRDSTANLVFRPAETITELSSVFDLGAGDLVATGTPAGCALRVPSPFVQKLGALLPEKTKWAIFLRKQRALPYLRPGQMVEASIKSDDGAIDLGVQRNRVVAEQ